MGKTHASRIRAANLKLIVQYELDSIGDFFSPDYVVHITDQRIELGHDGVREVLGLYQRAFPEISVEVEILAEAKDRIAWQRTLRGVQQGSYKGFPASGRQIVWRDMITSRFRDGLIAEEWYITDLAERLLLARKK